MENMEYHDLVLFRFSPDLARRRAAPLDGGLFHKALQK